VAEGGAPVEAVLLASEEERKGRRGHCCPQRARTPELGSFFPCKRAVYRGPPEGTVIAIVDPRQADAVVVDEGHAPVVAVLLAPLKLLVRLSPHPFPTVHPSPLTVDRGRDSPPCRSSSPAGNLLAQKAKTLRGRKRCRFAIIRPAANVTDLPVGCANTGRPGGGLSRTRSSWSSCSPSSGSPSSSSG
jgi:hypothetical protein